MGVLPQSLESIWRGAAKKQPSSLGEYSKTSDETPMEVTTCCREGKSPIRPYGDDRYHRYQTVCDQSPRNSGAKLVDKTSSKANTRIFGNALDSTPLHCHDAFVEDLRWQETMAARDRQRAGQIRINSIYIVTGLWKHPSMVFMKETSGVQAASV